MIAPDETPGDRAEPPAAPPRADLGAEAELDPMPPLPAAADVPADPADAFATKKGVEEYFYDEENRQFLRRNAAGSWISLAEGAFIRHLKKAHGLRDKPSPGKITSPAHDVVWEVENNRRVAYAGIVAGYKSGVHFIGGRRVLVTEDPVFIDPQKGEWPTLEKFFKGLFIGEEEGAEGAPPLVIDQTPWVYSWLQHVTQCFYEGKTSTGLAFGLAGDPNCGKSMFAMVLTWILGGRTAKPYRYMMGDDSFNRDLIEAVLWLIDDENQADTDYKSRQHFSGELKMTVANNEFRVRAMHTNPFAIPLLRRLVVLCNLQGTRLLVFPPLDGDVDDKLSLFKGYARPAPKAPITSDTPPEEACWPMPMPTRTEAERERFRDTLRAELPAFLHWLLYEYKMPSAVSGGRFVVRHYHHRELVAALHEHSPHVRLWDLIIRSQVVFIEYIAGDNGNPAYRKRRTEWQGSSGDLEVLLKKSEGSRLSKEEQQEIKASNWLGRTLDLCRQHFGEKHCVQKKVNGARVWVLHARPEDKIEE